MPAEGKLYYGEGVLAYVMPSPTKLMSVANLQIIMIGVLSTVIFAGENTINLERC